MALSMVDALTYTIGFIGKEHGGHAHRKYGVEQHKAGAMNAHNIDHQTKGDWQSAATQSTYSRDKTTDTAHLIGVIVIDGLEDTGAAKALGNTNNKKSIH